MPNATINKKTFNLVLNKTQTFILNISGFAISTALKVLIGISTINIFMTVKRLLRTTVGIYVSTVGINIAYKLKQKVAPAILTGKIGINLITKVLSKVTTNINFKLPLSITVKRLLKNVLSVYSGKVVLVLAPVVAVLILLSTLDPQLLSALDSQNLSQLDHS